MFKWLSVLLKLVRSWLLTIVPTHRGTGQPGQIRRWAILVWGFGAAIQGQHLTSFDKLRLLDFSIQQTAGCRRKAGHLLQLCHVSIQLACLQ
jgi:hypothetical protein